MITRVKNNFMKGKCIMKELLKRFINDESGMETLEWALVGALVVLGFVAIWVAFEPSLSNIFTQMGAELDAAATPAAP